MSLGQLWKASNNVQNRVLFSLAFGGHGLKMNI